MITLESIREYMRDQLEADRARQAVKVSGSSVEDALENAAIELGIPVKRLEYEIVEHGSKGMLGVGRKDWIILAYPTALKSEAGQAAAGQREADESREQTVIPDKDGEVFVRLTSEGVFLKVTKPTGRGGRAAERRAIEKLALRGVSSYDAALVSKVVRHADGEYIKVGDYQFNPVNQSTLSADITDMEMKAYMTVTPPGPGGAELSFEEIRGLLQSSGIVHGINNEAIRRFVDYPAYSEKILVAEGTKSQNGADAEIIYNFNVYRDEVQLKEKNGRVDFRELNLVENVEAGQILATKKPPEEGLAGRTVTGKSLPAKPGKNVQIEIGKNVKLSDDGMSAISTINGQVLLILGKINVEPIYTVEGDVNFKTGNILFLGTVIVKGNVEDGFTVKAAGNIEVMGSVGKCILDAEGEIIVHQGILGKNEGKVHAGSNLVAKFIENARVEVEENVLVSDGIIHSFVDANKRILCQGKRASIVGGRLRAANEIHAKTLGSVAGTETILEVGIDPKRKEKLTQAFKRKEELEKELEELVRNISTLENLKKVQRNFPEDKQKNLSELNDKRSVILQELEEIGTGINEINSYLQSIKVTGKVSASDRVFPGVKIFIKNENLIVRNEFKNVTFTLEDKEIRMVKYEPMDQVFSRRLAHASVTH
ncbi:MAG: FapA family protein [Spirochaetaceae bacterium]|nr:MAG: FapA family protein [Spirochaetaceae bacterium]